MCSYLLVTKKTNLSHVKTATGVDDEVCQNRRNDERPGLKLPQRDEMSVKNSLFGALNKGEIDPMAGTRKMSIDI